MPTFHAIGTESMWTLMLMERAAQGRSKVRWRESDIPSSWIDAQGPSIGSDVEMEIALTVPGRGKRYYACPLCVCASKTLEKPAKLKEH